MSFDVRSAKHTEKYDSTESIHVDQLVNKPKKAPILTVSESQCRRDLDGDRYGRKYDVVCLCVLSYYNGRPYYSENQEVGGTISPLLPFQVQLAKIGKRIVPTSKNRNNCFYAAAAFTLISSAAPLDEVGIGSSTTPLDDDEGKLEAQKIREAGGSDFDLVSYTAGVNALRQNGGEVPVPADVVVMEEWMEELQSVSAGGLVTFETGAITTLLYGASSLCGSIAWWRQDEACCWLVLLVERRVVGSTS